MGGVNDLSGSRLMLVLLFLVSLVSVVAVIVAAVSLTSSGSDTPSISVNSPPGGASSSAGSSPPIVINTGSGGSGSGAASGDRIFKIAYYEGSNGFTYLDETGFMKGFTLDLVNGVCEIGGMNCVTIWDEVYNCWTREPGGYGRGGQGLFNGWYDACAHLSPNVNNVQVFDFSLPYGKVKTYQLYVLKSNNDFHAGDLTGKTIGFLRGASADSKCLARHGEIKGNALPMENIKEYDRPDATFDALRNGEVDAIFGSLNYYKASADQLKIADGPRLACALAGSSLMSRKDNDFNSHWNRAFQKFKDSGKFKKLCEQANIDHAHKGGISPCVDSP